MIDGSLGIDLRRFRQGLRTRSFGTTLLWFSRLGSTNRTARDLAELWAPDGTVIVADFQTAGHGRYDRPWLSDPGQSLLLSTILRPSIPASDVFFLTMIPALAVKDAVASYGVRGVALKWPNDVQIEGRKVAGILTELSTGGEQLDYVVVGIGLNVNFAVERYPEIATSATSIGQALGKALDVTQVAQRLLEAFEDRYAAFVGGGADEIFRDWRASLNTIGRWVAVAEGSAVSYKAYAQDVTSDGGLVVVRDGQRQVVYGGEVTLAAS